MVKNWPYNKSFSDPIQESLNKNLKKIQLFPNNLNVSQNVKKYKGYF